MTREHLWYVIVWVAGTFFAAACQGQTREQSRSMFTFIAYAVMSDVAPAPTPTPTPVTDTCENCNGRGWVGDGRPETKTACPECDGTGKRKKVAAAIQEVKTVAGWPPKDTIEIIESMPVRKVTLAHGYNLSDGPSDYRPRWTWPGDLRQHLQQTHKIDTISWTQDQREMYHDQWHDRYGSR